MQKVSVEHSQSLIFFSFEDILFSWSLLTVTTFHSPHYYIRTDYPYTQTQTQITCSLLRNNPLVFRDPPASSLPGAFLVLSLFRNDSRARRSLLFRLQFFFFLNQRESRRRKPRIASPNDFFPSLSARRERTLAMGERQETHRAPRAFCDRALSRAAS